MKQCHVAMIGLQIAVTISVDSQKFRYRKSDLTEMRGQIKEGLVFLNVGIVGADEGLFRSDDTVIPSCRSRLSNGFDVGYVMTDG